MAAIGSDVPHGFLPQTQLSNPALLAWKVGSVVNTRRTSCYFIAVMLIHVRRNHKFRPRFADQQAETLCVFYEKMTILLLPKFLLHCRRERCKIVTYSNLDIKT